MNGLFSRKKLNGKGRGFSLLELLIVTVILGILVTGGMIYYHSTVEKSRANEVYAIFGQARSGWLALKEEGVPVGFNPNVGVASNGWWLTLRMDNPNANPSLYFCYDVFEPGFSGPNAWIWANRRTALGAYSAACAAAKNVRMNLDTGEIQKTSHY